MDTMYFDAWLSVYDKCLDCGMIVDVKKSALENVLRFIEEVQPTKRAADGEYTAANASR